MPASYVTYTVTNTSSTTFAIGNSGTIPPGVSTLTVLQGSADQNALLYLDSTNPAIGFLSGSQPIQTGVAGLGYTYQGIWANRPNANSVPVGTEIAITDIPGATGNSALGLRTYFYSDGTYWRPENGAATLAAYSCPVVIPSNGTIGSNGALSAIVSLPAAISGYFYYPLNAINTGSAAGFYWTVLGTVNTGTVYTKTWSTGPVLPPATPTLFSGTTGAAYIQTAASPITIASIPIPANLMTPTGALRRTFLAEWINNSGNKVLIDAFGGTTVSTLTATTSATEEAIPLIIRNRGVTGKQVVNATTAYGSTATALTILSIDTTANQNYTITGQITTAATDYIILDGLTLELIA